MKQQISCLLMEYYISSVIFCRKCSVCTVNSFWSHNKYMDLCAVHDWLNVSLCQLKGHSTFRFWPSSSCHNVPMFGNTWLTALLLQLFIDLDPEEDVLVVNTYPVLLPLVLQSTFYINYVSFKHLYATILLTIVNITHHCIHISHSTDMSNLDHPLNSKYITFFKL